MESVVGKDTYGFSMVCFIFYGGTYYVLFNNPENQKCLAANK